MQSAKKPAKENPDFKPFRMMITAPSAAGKSFLIKKLLTNELRGKFDTIYVIVPTLHQALWQSIKIKNKTDEATSDKFMEYYEQIKKNRQEGKESLLILDDCISTELTRPNSVLCREILRLRHYWCSIIIASQLYKGVPPFVRNNVDMMTIFHTPNRDESHKMITELGDNFESSYHEYTKKKYSYVFCDFRKNELDPTRYSNTIEFLD